MSDVHKELAALMAVGGNLFVQFPVYDTKSDCVRREFLATPQWNCLHAVLTCGPGDVVRTNPFKARISD